MTGITEPRLAHGEFHRYEARSLPVVALGRSAPHSPDQDYHQPDLADRMRDVLTRIRPDLVHFHAIQGLGVEMVEAAQQANYIPTVVTLHDAWWFCERQFMVRASGRWCGQTAIDARVCATCVGRRRPRTTAAALSTHALNQCAKVLTPVTTGLR